MKKLVLAIYFINIFPGAVKSKIVRTPSREKQEEIDMAKMSARIYLRNPYNSAHLSRFLVSEVAYNSTRKISAIELTCATNPRSKYWFRADYKKIKNMIVPFPEQITKDEFAEFLACEPKETVTSYGTIEKK